jgi:hypothetical protein
MRDKNVLIIITLIILISGSLIFVGLSLKKNLSQHQLNHQSPQFPNPLKNHSRSQNQLTTQTGKPIVMKSMGLR